MSIRKETLIPIIAIVFLSIATLSSAYVFSTQEENVVTETIIIADEEYNFNVLWDSIEKRTEIVAEEEYEGIGLDSLIEYIGIEDPSAFTYRFIASDGYAKTVEWTHLQDGILTLDRRSVFTDLPKAFSVRDVIEIEVS